MSNLSPGDHVLVLPGYGENFAVPVSGAQVGDSVILYPLGEGQTKLAVPILSLEVGDFMFVSPDFNFAGFDWKIPFEFRLIPLNLIFFGVDGVAWASQWATGGGTVWRYGTGASSYLILASTGAYARYTTTAGFRYFAWKTLESDDNDGVAQIYFNDVLFTEEDTQNQGTRWWGPYEINKTEGFSAKIVAKDAVPSPGISQRGHVKMNVWAFFNDPEFDYEAY